MSLVYETAARSNTLRIKILYKGRVLSGAPIEVPRSANWLNKVERPSDSNENKVPQVNPIDKDGLVEKKVTSSGTKYVNVMGASQVSKQALKENNPLGKSSVSNSCKTAANCIRQMQVKCVKKAPLNEGKYRVDSNQCKKLVTNSAGTKYVTSVCQSSSRLENSSVTPKPNGEYKRRYEVSLDNRKRKRPTVISRDTGLNVKSENTKKNAEFDAKKVKHASTLQSEDRYDESTKDNKNDFATCGSLGASVEDLERKLDLHLFPSRALHVAKMKERYAELILKAQHQKLREPGWEIDTKSLQQKKELLQRRLLNEDKAKLEARIKVDEASKQPQAKWECKKQSQAEREAAHISFKKLEQSFDVNDKLQVSKVHHGGKPKSPLERLGLYLKEEYKLGDANDYALSKDEDIEEGEIV